MECYSVSLCASSLVVLVKAQALLPSCQHHILLVPQLLHPPENGAPPMHKKMLAGMASGALGSLIFNPIELVKTRQQGAAGGGDGAFRYNGPLDGMKKLYASEGVSASTASSHFCRAATPCCRWGCVL